MFFFCFNWREIIFLGTVWKFENSNNPKSCCYYACPEAIITLKKELVNWKERERKRVSERKWGKGKERGTEEIPRATDRSQLEASLNANSMNYEGRPPRVLRHIDFLFFYCRSQIAVCIILIKIDAGIKQKIQFCGI